MSINRKSEPRKLTAAEFACAMKLHRDRLKITQKEAATILEVSPRVIWKWENEQGETLYPTQHGALVILRDTPVKK